MFTNINSYFDKEIILSMRRISKDINNDNISEDFYHAVKNMNMIMPLVSNEIYLIFDNKEQKRKNILDFVLSEMFSWYTFDWIIDNDIKNNIEKYEIESRLLEHIGKKKISDLDNISAIKYFENKVRKFIEASYEEKFSTSDESNLNDYVKNIEKKSHAFTALFGTSATLGNANKEQLENVEEFSKNFYVVCQVWDDYCDKKEITNKKIAISKREAGKISEEYLGNCFTWIDRMPKNWHTDYLKNATKLSIHE